MSSQISLRNHWPDAVKWAMTTTQLSQSPTCDNTIYVTNADKQRLEDLLMEVKVSDPRKQGDFKGLVAELGRALVVAPSDLPSDVITMNSRAELRDLESGETVAFTLVFPSEANIDEDKISVLAPIGAAMLGYRVGNDFEWKVPAGTRRMRVEKVHYQPEAAGDLDR
jgi:regulator of nucleoside diphosphate kinase